ncbi:MAG: hypothetical protein ACLR06_09920 [Christensenellaceae bacterium]
MIENTSLKALTTSKTGYTIVPDLSDIDSVFRGVISSLLKNDMNTEDWLCVRLNISLLFMEIAKSVRLLEQNNVHYIKRYGCISSIISAKKSLSTISRGRSDTIKLISLPNSKNTREKRSFKRSTPCVSPKA